MTQEESIALFLCCERGRNSALAAGKDEDQAHEAARAIWNGWAEAVLECQPSPISGDDCTQVLWILDAIVDFSWTTFRRVRDTAHMWSETGEGTLVEVQSASVRFDGFIFPALVLFDSARFELDVQFCGATFGAAKFRETAFERKADFHGSIFEEAASFEAACFGGKASFDNAHFLATPQLENLVCGDCAPLEAVLLEHGMSNAFISTREIH
jgi:hypothetical protein